MPLTPIEVRHLEMRRGLFGYRRSQVHGTIEEIADSFEEVWRERSELGERVHELEAEVARHVELETLLRSTLVSAERAAQDMKEQARREADVIVSEAGAEGRRLVRDAIKIALRNRGFSATAYNTPTGNIEQCGLSRQLKRFGAVVGLLVCDLDDARQMREAATVVAEVPLRWLVLTATRLGPGWGAMVEAGAAGVVPMSTGLDQLAQAVKAVIAGTPVMRLSTRMAVLRQWQAQGAELARLADQIEGDVGQRHILFHGRGVAAPFRQPVPEDQGVIRAAQRVQHQRGFRDRNVAA